MSATAEGLPIFMPLVRDVLLRAKLPAAIIPKADHWLPVRVLTAQWIVATTRH